MRGVLLLVVSAVQHAYFISGRRPCGLENNVVYPYALKMLFGRSGYELYILYWFNYCLVDIESTICVVGYIDMLNLMTTVNYLNKRVHIITKLLLLNLDLQMKGILTYILHLFFFNI